MLPMDLEKPTTRVLWFIPYFVILFLVRFLHPYKSDTVQVDTAFCISVFVTSVFSVCIEQPAGMAVSVLLLAVCFIPSSISSLNAVLHTLKIVYTVVVMFLFVVGGPTFWTDCVNAAWKKWTPADSNDVSIPKRTGLSLVWSCVSNLLWCFFCKGNIGLGSWVGIYLFAFASAGIGLNFNVAWIMILTPSFVSMMKTFITVSIVDKQTRKLVCAVCLVGLCAVYGLHEFGVISFHPKNKSMYTTITERPATKPVEPEEGKLFDREKVWVLSELEDVYFSICGIEYIRLGSNVAKGVTTLVSDTICTLNDGRVFVQECMQNRNCHSRVGYGMLSYIFFELAKGDMLLQVFVWHVLAPAVIKVLLEDFGTIAVGPVPVAADDRQEVLNGIAAAMADRMHAEHAAAGPAARARRGAAREPENAVVARPRRGGRN